MAVAVNVSPMALAGRRPATSAYICAEHTSTRTRGHARPIAATREDLTAVPRETSAAQAEMRDFAHADVGDG